MISLKPSSIILYGSIAKGEYGVGSDVDLLIISDLLPKDFLNRLKLLSELNSTTAPIEALAYTSTEFKVMLKRLHPMVLSTIEDGIIIYDDGFFKFMKKRSTLLRKRLKIFHVEDGWEVLNPSKRFKEF